MGPQESRFHTHLQGADHAKVQDNGANAWLASARLLDKVAAALHVAAASGTTIEGYFGPALDKAFKTTATAMNEKSKVLAKGSHALGSAADAISQAQAARTQMNSDYPAVTDPGPKKTTTPADIADGKAPEHAKHNAKVDEYQATMKHREHVSQQWADHLDTVFAQSAATMASIHGTDPVPPGNAGGGDNAQAPTANPPAFGHPGHPGGTSHPGSTGPTGPRSPGPGRDPVAPTPGSPQGPPIGQPPADPGAPGSPSGPGSPGSPSSPGYPSPSQPTSPGQPGQPGQPVPVGAVPTSPATGLSPGAVGGVLGGGVLGTGALVGGIKSGALTLPGSLSSRGVAPIGSTSGTTSGTSSVLGRSTGVAGEEGGTGGTSSGGRTGGVGGARGGSAGGRAGGRSGGTGSGGRGGGRDKRKRGPSDRDLFDDGQDWLDDEGAAPSVLD